MANAQYLCPICGWPTARRCTYCAGSYEHKCTRCGSLNKIFVRGSSVFTPRVDTIINLKKKLKV